MASSKMPSTHIWVAVGAAGAATLAYLLCQNDDESDEAAVPTARPKMQRRKSWQEGQANTAIANEGVRVSHVAREWHGLEEVSGSEDEPQAMHWQEREGLPLRGSGVFRKTVSLAEEEKEWKGADLVSDDDDHKAGLNWQEQAGIPLRQSAVYTHNVQMAQCDKEWGNADDVSSGEDEAEQVPTVGFKRGSKFDLMMDMEKYNAMIAQQVQMIAQQVQAITQAPPKSSTSASGRRMSWQVNVLGENTVEKGEAFAGEAQVHQSNEWEYRNQISDSDSDDEDEGLAAQLASGDVSWKRRVTWQERTGQPLEGTGVFIKRVDKVEHDDEWEEYDTTDEEVGQELKDLRKAGAWQELNGLPLRKSAVYVKPVRVTTAASEWVNALELSDSEEDRHSSVMPFRRGAFSIRGMSPPNVRPTVSEAVADLPDGAGNWSKSEKSEKSQRRKSWQAEVKVDQSKKSVEMKSIPLGKSANDWAGAMGVSDSESEGDKPEGVAPEGRRKSWQELAGLPLRGSAVATVAVKVEAGAGDWADGQALSESDDEAPQKRRGSWQEEAGQPLQGTGVYVKTVDLDEVDREWSEDKDEDDELAARRGSWQEEAGLPLEGTGVFVKPVTLAESATDWAEGEHLTDDEVEKQEDKVAVPVKKRGSLVQGDLAALEQLQPKKGKKGKRGKKGKQ